jgi:hypothetical protein
MTKRKDPKDYLPLGRPSGYKEEYCEELIKFFNIDSYKEKIVKDRNGGERREIIPCKFPTLARFACNIGIDRETLWQWATAKLPNGEPKYPNFSNAYKRAKDFQESILVEGAMIGAFSQPFAIFTAKNVLGWKDKQEVENTGTVEINYHGGLPVKSNEI